MNLEHLRGRRITVVEVGPRDGLQSERVVLSTSDKIAFVDMLSAANFPVIEVASFVSPKWVPQMQDAEGVFSGIAKRSRIRYMALVPNITGFERAAASGVRQIAIFAAASETFSRKNINQSIDASLDTYSAVCARAIAEGLRVRAYLSTAFGCPYEGPVPAERVVEIAQRLLDMGAFEVAISDTIGVAHPAQVLSVLEMLLKPLASNQLALHLHDTRGTALANVLAGLSMGIETFDASAGGLGGCPYAPGAAGNLASDDLIYMLNGLGVETGVSLAALSEASAFIATRLDHTLPSRYALAAAATRQKRDGDSGAD